MKSLIAFLVVLPQVILCQEKIPDSLDWFIRKEVADYKIPGLAIGIVKDNRIVLNNGYGLTSTNDSNHITSETIFPILSCTKAFTAAAMAILVDEGKVKWEDKVVKYSPGFRLSNPWITKHLTISDLLSHRSGLESFEGDLLWYGTNYSRDEIIRRIRYSPLKNKFRKDFGYQNIMYLVAGQIIENVSGKSWDAYVKEKLFTPLHMNHSSTSINEIGDNVFALPHLSNHPISPMNLDNIAPAGSINSNTSDMLAWLQLWMNNGNFNGNQIISKASVETMTSPKIFLSDSKDQSYGLGWQIESNKNHKVISHGGGMPGCKSLITIDPERKVGIIILTNKISYLPEELTGVILDYFDTVKIHWLERDKNLMTKNFKYPWEDLNEIGTQLKSIIPNFEEYKGIYEDKQYGKAIIEKNSDTAIINFIPAKNNLRAYLYNINVDTFGIVFTDPFIPSGKIIFKRGSNKKVTSFKLDIPQGDFNFKYFNFIRKEGL